MQRYVEALKKTLNKASEQILDDLRDLDYLQEILGIFEDEDDRREGNEEKFNTRSPFEDLKNPKHSVFLGVSKHPKNLIFQGGGVKGLAYLSALKVFKNQDPYFLSRITKIAGTSAGAIIATLLAVGYTVEELEVLMKSTKFSDFLDYRSKNITLETLTKLIPDFIKEERSPKVHELSDLFLNLIDISSEGAPLSLRKGLCHGEFLRKWLDKKITEKVRERLKEIDPQFIKNNQDFGKTLTFGELGSLALKHPQTFKNLWVTAVKVPELKLDICNSLDVPWKDVIVSDAGRASASIPGLFKFHTLHAKIKGKRVSFSSDYVDGGLLDNYPIRIFDDENSPNKYTLGFSLLSQEEIKIIKGKNQENNVFKGVLKRLYLSPEIIKHQTKVNVLRTVYIDPLGIGMTQFDLSREKTDCLMLSGKQAVYNFICNSPAFFGNSTDCENAEQLFRNIQQNCLSNHGGRLNPFGIFSGISSLIQLILGSLYNLLVLSQKNRKHSTDLALIPENKPNKAWSFICGIWDDPYTVEGKLLICRVLNSENVEVVSVFLRSTFLEQSLRTAVEAMSHGAIRGTSNVVNYALHLGEFSEKVRRGTYGIIYYGGMFILQYIHRYMALSSENLPEIQKMTMAATSAVWDMASLILMQILINPMCQLLNRLGEKAKQHDWNKLGQVFQWVSYWGSYSMYAYSAYIQGIFQALISIFSGFLSEKVVEKTGKCVVNSAVKFSQLYKSHGLLVQRNSQKDEGEVFDSVDSQIVVKN